ncbi:MULTISPECIES: hypothetical protein [Aerococcus]|uniref:hypothetical protein n=1 Tax=Aerococcus TaxID=1375 RepID=UPI0018A74941|nr:MULTISPECIES: hypothetical protein [Aerococcus]MCY3039210.1 hypothetical protein [Aerococcus sp. Group 2]MCY3041111.1 hypothetical protein [Aerococcus sp. Group 2]MCY3042349.1 hypothetical protein [Aerococcus sp. Group 2]MDK6521351.1 hypothetical protein [Aerococcus urinae]
MKEDSNHYHKRRHFIRSLWQKDRYFYLAAIILEIAFVGIMVEFMVNPSWSIALVFLFLIWLLLTAFVNGSLLVRNLPKSSYWHRVGSILVEKSIEALLVGLVAAGAIMILTMAS